MFSKCSSFGSTDCTGSAGSTGFASSAGLTVSTDVVILNLRGFVPLEAGLPFFSLSPQTTSENAAA